MKLRGTPQVVMSRKLFLTWARPESGVDALMMIRRGADMMNSFHL